MALHLAKKASDPHDQSLEDIAAASDADAALERIQENAGWRPLNSFVTAEMAVKCEKLLSGSERLYAGTRGSAYKIVEFLCDSSNFYKSQGAMCKELGFPVLRIKSIEMSWPYFWQFTNLIVRTTLHRRSEARVEGATCEAAITGNDRDRRLYYELTNRIKQRGQQDAGSHGHIYFINNVINRPEVTEVSAKPEGLQSDDVIDLALDEQK